METTYYSYMKSPLGKLLLAGDRSGLKWIGLPKDRYLHGPDPSWVCADKPFEEVMRQLDAYFEGNLKSFDLPLAPQGSPFQQSVWRALNAIPYARTASYGDIARRIRKPQAGRAVGGAVGRNPLPIVIPCHRVIGSDGSLTGYGGGLAVKEALLALERKNALSE
jgi:methylated-DNA-[protein]-cysteine S-methyltransferase